MTLSSHKISVTKPQITSSKLTLFKATIMVLGRGRNTITFVAGALIAASVIFVANEVLNSFTDGFLEDRRSLSLETEPQFVFDPATVEGKSYEDAEGLQEDGTYLLLHDEFHQGPGLYCMPMVEAKDLIKRVHYHFAFCKLFDDMFGNRLGLVYGMKMLAYAMRKPFTFTCGMAEGESPLGAAYFMDLNSDVPGPVPNHDGVEYSPEVICADICHGRFCDWTHHNLDVASDAMVADWKQLASPEIVSITDHDDAVIHLRLGDGLYSTAGANEGKGIFPHATYINLLKQAEEEKGAIGSIGIVTAPFKGDKLRPFDNGSTSISEMIALDLVEALQSAFPSAQVRLLNSPESTIIESLARLVHAKKAAVCGCSTFCPYATLATEGIGFMYLPVGRQNQWVRNAAKWHPNFRLFETPMLNGLVINNNKVGYIMPIERVKRWLREQDSSIGNVDITEAPIFRHSR